VGEERRGSGRAGKGRGGGRGLLYFGGEGRREGVAVEGMISFEGRAGRGRGGGRHGGRMEGGGGGVPS